MFNTVKLLVYIDGLILIGAAILYLCLNKENWKEISPFDIALGLSIPFVGLLGGSKEIYWLYLFTLPLLSVGSPNNIVKRFLFVFMMFPAASADLIIQGKYLGSFSGITFLNLGTLFALALTTKKRTRAYYAIDVAIWTIFVVDIFLNARGTPISGIARETIATFAEVTVPFYVVARTIHDRRSANGATLFFTLGAVCNGVIALFEARRHWPLYQAFADALNLTSTGLSATLSMRAGFMRAQGAVTNPAVLGLVCAMAAIIVLASRSRFSPAGRWIIVGLLSAANIAAQSRGAWIAEAVGVFLLFLYERRHMALAVMGTGAIALGAAILLAGSSGGRFSELVGRSGHGEITAEYRSDLLKRGVQEVLQHPVTGQTRDELQLSMNDMRQGEGIIDFVNTHLYVALVGGLGLFALWLAAWFAPMGMAWRRRSRVFGEEGQLSPGVPFAMMGTCLACLTFTSPIGRMMPLAAMSFGLLSASLRLPRREVMRTRRPMPRLSERRLAHPSVVASEAV